MSRKRLKVADTECSLQINFPHIATEINIPKTLKLYPDLRASDISFHSHANIWWTCSQCTWEYKSVVRERVSKQQGCPMCPNHVPMSTILNDWTDVIMLNVAQVTCLRGQCTSLASHCNLRTNRKHIKGQNWTLSEISSNFLFDLFYKQRGLCAYSGLKLSFTRSSPDWSMSIERTDPRIGYTQSNTVFIVQELNCARTWTKEKLSRLILLAENNTMLNLDQFSKHIEVYKSRKRSAKRKMICNDSGQIEQLHCATCKQMLHVSQFSRWQNRKIPFKSHCKKCTNIYNKTHIPSPKDQNSAGICKLLDRSVRHAKKRLQRILERQKEYYTNWTLKHIEHDKIPTRDLSFLPNELVKCIYRFWDTWSISIDVEKLYENIWISHVSHMYNNIVTVEELFEMFIKQNARCKYSNVPLTSEGDWILSLERFDRGKSYTLDNCCLVAAEFNTSKQWNKEKFQQFIYSLKNKN